LSIVAKLDFQKYLDKIIPLIILSIEDPNSEKTLNGIITLGKVISYTGYVIQIYYDYPKLIDLLFNLLKNDNFRTEILKLIGIMGAIDPYELKKIKNENKVDILLIEYQNEKTQKEDFETMKSENYIPKLVLNSLCKLLKDSVSNHPLILDCIINIILHLNSKSIPFLPQIVPSIINTIKTSKTIEKKKFCLSRLNTIIKCSKSSIEPFLEDLLGLLFQIWDNYQDLKINLISIIDNISFSLKKGFIPYLAHILPVYLDEFKTDNLKNDSNGVILKLLDSFILYETYLNQYIDMILPSLIGLIEDVKDDLIIIKTLNVIENLFDKGFSSFSEFSSLVIHPICRILNGHYSNNIKNSAMDTLSSVIYLIGYDFLIYLPNVSKIVIKNNLQNERYTLLINQLLKNKNFEDLYKEEILDESYDRNNYINDENVEIDVESYKINIEKLTKAWQSNQRATSEDWIDWISKLSNRLLLESPSFFLRCCAQLSLNHPNLTKDLFNCSFYVIWKELNE
jgi:serine/threonine-protein kinase mTOR